MFICSRKIKSAENSVQNVYACKSFASPTDAHLPSAVHGSAFQRLFTVQVKSFGYSGKSNIEIYGSIITIPEPQLPSKFLDDFIAEFKCAQKNTHNLDG